jgi:hypothetical protein
MKRLSGKSDTAKIAGSPDEWFEYLDKNGTTGLRLAWVPRNNPSISDRMSAGFVGGGGIWLIEALNSSGESDVWVAKWEVQDQNDPDKRIWKVGYYLVNRMKTPAVKEAVLSDIKDRFLTVLDAIRELSLKAGQYQFTDNFDNALETLSADDIILHGHHKDIYLTDYISKDAIKLLDAAQSAYVFGGMGSWNDINLKDESLKSEYEKVSEELFQILNKVIVAATNASLHPSTKE